MEANKRRHQATLLPPLVRTKDADNLDQPRATGAAVPQSEKVVSNTDIQGLREQIFSNAVALFPKAALPYMYGHHVPHNVFDIITIRRPRARTPPPASNSAMAEPQITYDWCAYLVCGPVTGRATAASGPFRTSIEGALHALLEFLAEKIVPGRHFHMPERQFDHGSRGWDENLLGVHGMG